MDICMLLSEGLSRLLNRFRYPVSLPEDIAKDLGIALPPTASLASFLKKLASSPVKSSKLRKMMSRCQAEIAFRGALQKETFSSCSLFSYYFNEGWVVISLYFDEDSKLRRAYLQCPADAYLEGFEIAIEERPFYIAAS